MVAAALDLVADDTAPRGGSPNDMVGLAWLRDCLNSAFPLDAARRPRLAREDAGTRIPLTPRSSAKPTRAPAAPEVSIDGSERRAEERAPVSLYRTAMLRWDGMESLCIIRNVSPGGMMIKLPARLAPGQQATVEMRSGHVIPGRIAWAKDGAAGMQFDTRIDVAEVLNGAHREVPSWRQRGPRLHVTCGATLLAANGRQNSTVIDVSQGGAKLEADFLRQHDDVVVAIKGLDPRRGVVRWTREGRAGIAFHACIPFDTLAQWAVARQQCEAAPGDQRVGAGSAPE